MKLLRKVDNFISKIEKIFLSGSMIMTTIILFGNVIARRVFQSSWSWSEEVGQLMVVIMTFMGVGYAARTGEHINMSAFTDLASNNKKKRLALLISFITMITMFIFSFLSLKYTLRVVASGRVTPALEMPRYIFAIFLPIGFLLGGIQYLINFILNLRYKNRVYFSNVEPAVDMDKTDVVSEKSGDSEQDASRMSVADTDEKIITDKENRR